MSDYILLVLGAIMILVGGGVASASRQEGAPKLRLAGIGFTLSGIGLMLWSCVASPFVPDDNVVEAEWMVNVLSGLSHHWTDHLPVIGVGVFLVGVGLLAFSPAVRRDDA